MCDWLGLAPNQGPAPAARATTAIFTGPKSSGVVTLSQLFDGCGKSIFAWFMFTRGGSAILKIPHNEGIRRKIFGYLLDLGPVAGRWRRGGEPARMSRNKTADLRIDCKRAASHFHILEGIRGDLAKNVAYNEAIKLDISR